MYSTTRYLRRRPFADELYHPRLEPLEARNLLCTITTTYTLKDLGILPDSDGGSGANAIFDAAHIAGRSNIGDTQMSPLHAVTWDSTTDPITITELPDPSSQLTSGARGITYDIVLQEEHIAGYAFVQVGSLTPPHAFYYTKGVSKEKKGVFKDLKTLGDDSLASHGDAIALVDGVALVAGGSEIVVGSNTRNHAFYWSAETEDFTDIHQWSDNSEAHGINTNGLIVGRTDVTIFQPAGQHAFSYDIGTGVMVDLDDDNDWYFSAAYAVNDNGVAAGTANVPNGHLRAVKFENGEVDDLGATPGTDSEAFGINNSGQIVGRAKPVSPGPGAADGFLYEDDGGFCELTDLLDSNTPPGWKVSNARAINNAGLIAGWGSYSYQGTEYLHGILLTPVGVTIPPPPDGPGFDLFGSDQSSVLGGDEQRAENPTQNTTVVAEEAAESSDVETSNESRPVVRNTDSASNAGELDLKLDFVL